MPPALQNVTKYLLVFYSQLLKRVNKIKSFDYCNQKAVGHHRLGEFLRCLWGGRRQRLQALLRKLIKLGLTYTTFWGPFQAILFSCLPPPPPSFRKTMLRFFATNFLHWSDPPSPIPKIHCFFPLKITAKNATKFLNRKWPPLPLWKFSENSSKLETPIVP